MAMTLKPKFNRNNGSVQKSQEREKHVKFEQMWKFCSFFSSIAMAWCIMNSCHKVLRSIRIISLKLCSDCAKQFIRKALNCGNTNHEFCTILAAKSPSPVNTVIEVWLRCLCMSFWPKTKSKSWLNHRIHRTWGLGPRWLCSFPETKDTDELKTTIKETAAVFDIK